MRDWDAVHAWCGVAWDEVGWGGVTGRSITWLQPAASLIPLWLRLWLQRWVSSSTAQLTAPPAGCLAVSFESLTGEMAEARSR
mmetsp:Transcript_58766/g.130992  ORF Transcript_58766/g.130992 Transcript_58766/m.130992 type:complete len:83 (-) Transcript_58766:669-917(-)